MKFLWVLFFLSAHQLLTAQNNAACIEKSTRNNYFAQRDTSLTLYKAISQTGNTKILLFTVRSSANIDEVPTLAKVNFAGDIIWSRALVASMPDYKIRDFDAITLHDNSIFVFCIARPSDQNSPILYSMLWFNENGSLIRQTDYKIKNDPALEVSLTGHIKLTETASGNILFVLDYTLQNNSQGIVLVANIAATGVMKWSKFLNAEKAYGLIDLITYNNYIVLQGLSGTRTYPYALVLNSTKLNLADGAILSSVSYRDRDIAFASLGSPASVSILTDNYKIKTLVSWRIPYYYQIYFSFTQDTSLNTLQGTTFYTTTQPQSYIPSSATLNKKGMGLITSGAPYDNTNTSFLLTDMNDVILQQKKVDNPTLSVSPKVAFDNADSFYFYWSGKKDNRNIVGWIKSDLKTEETFCGVRDSSFIRTADYPMAKYDLQLNSLSENVFEPASLNITLSSPTIIKELVCEKITGFCNPIKIRPVDTICSISQPVTITVNKNPECRGKIVFKFDSIAVKNWQQTNDTTLLLYFDKSWSGKILATASFCPLVKDSIQLVVNAPLPGIDLGNDTILCKGDTLRLFAGNEFQSYNWQNGSANTIFYPVTGEGTYTVIVKDNCDRSYYDTIKIILIDKKVDLGPDLSICKKETAQLTIKGKFSSFTWTPSYNINTVNTSTVIISPEITTSYKLTALTPEGCIAKDTILVTVKDCPLNFFVPDAFTPNNDGKNDIFKPIVTAPLEQYEFSIYNRWGERIFYTTEKSKGWNGKLAGIDQQTGTFVWICKYKFYGQPITFKKGSFLLIR